MGIIIKHDTKKYITNKLSLYAKSPERLDPKWKSAIETVIEQYKKEEERIAQITSVTSYINMRYKERRNYNYISDMVYCDRQSSFRYNDDLIINVALVAVGRKLIKLDI